MKNAKKAVGKPVAKKNGKKTKKVTLLEAAVRGAGMPTMGGD